jgi:hypothetical protein
MKINYARYIVSVVGCIMLACNDPRAMQYRKILLSHPTVISQNVPDYYLNLFQQKARGKIKLTTSLEHIGRDTVCDFLYDGKYYIALYTISRSYDFSLQNSLRESFSEISVEYSIPFYDNGIHSVGIRSRAYINGTAEVNPSNILITFSGDRFSKNEKNDSIADYFFECKNLSIKYKESVHQDVFVEAEGHTPLEVMFIKKEKKLFLIFITTKKDSTLFPDAIGKSLFN